MNKKLHIFVLVSIVALTFVTLTGCSMDRWMEVEGGDYMPVDTESVHASPAADLINSIHIDRENNSIKLMLADGSIITNSFSVRPKQEWPSGCPANLGSTRMEVLDLELNKITIGNIVINDPILVRNCPDNPERVILREDGQIGGAGTACAQNVTCIHFKLGNPSESIYNSEALSEDEYVIITLERTACFGTCPVYSLTIRGEGTVVYEGKDHVEIKGKVETTITQDQIDELISEFEKVDYFALEGSYTARTITDAPTVITSISIDGKTKTIEHYHGDFSAPEKLRELEDRIDEIVDSDQWIK
jgi:hypothetical protein